MNVKVHISRFGLTTVCGRHVNDSVNEGQVYRCEVQEYLPFTDFTAGPWQPADDMCEE